jgi:hypothetical protein
MRNVGGLAWAGVAHSAAVLGVVYEVAGVCGRSWSMRVFASHGW